MIEKNNLTIRYATKQDAQLLQQWWKDKHLMKDVGFPDGLKMTLDDVQKTLNQDHKKLFILEISNQPIGEMNITYENQEATFGIKIIPNYQNNDLGKKYITLLVEKLFNTTSIQTIKVNVNLTNTRARHVYEQCGFQLEHIAYDDWVDAKGKLQSTAYYKLSNPIMKNLLF